MEFKNINGAVGIITVGKVKFLLNPRFAMRDEAAQLKFVTPEADVPEKFNLPLPLSILKDVDAIVDGQQLLTVTEEEVLRAIPEDFPVFVPDQTEAEMLRQMGLKAVSVITDETAFRGIQIQRTPCVLNTRPETGNAQLDFSRVAQDVCGVMFQCQQCGDIFYFVGATLFYDGIKRIIDHFKPQVVLVNSGEGEPIVKGTRLWTIEDIKNLSDMLPNSKVLINCNNSTTDNAENRSALRIQIEETNLKNVIVPKVNQVINFD